MAPWEEARPSGFDGLDRAGTDLVSQRYYPWFAFLNDTAQRGDSVLWSPLEGFGQPFFALWRSRCLSPFSVPYYLLPLHQAFRVSVLLKFLVAGLSALYMARRFGFARPLRPFVVVTFQLSALLVIHRMAPLGDVIPWFPLLLVFAERLSVGQLRRWPLGAVTLALMLLGGEPGAVLGAFFLVAVYLVFRIALGRRAPGETPYALAALASAGLVAVGLSAVQILPHVEFLREAVPGDAARGGWPTLVNLAAALFPDFWGVLPSSLHQNAAASHAYAVRCLHFGLFPALLLPLWFAVRGFTTAAQRQRIEPMLMTCGVMTVLTIGLGHASRYWAIPGILQPEFLMIGNALMLALAGAASAEEWVLLNAEECTSSLKRLALFVPAMAVIAVLLVVVARPEPRPQAPDFTDQAIMVAVFTVALVALMVTTLLRPSVRVIGYGLWALSFAQLAIAFHAAFSFGEPSRSFPETSFINTLKTDGERVAGTSLLNTWPLSGNLIPQVGLPSMQGPGRVALRRQAAFLSRLNDDPLLLRRAGASNLLLTREDIQGRFAGIRPVLKVKQVFSCGAALFEDAAGKPRAWVAYDARAIDEFDPSLLGSRHPPVVERAEPPNSDPEEDAKVRIVPPMTNARVCLRVEEASPGILVLTDAWYPGWKATVDGEEAAVFPVDGAFRGVALDEGSHEVVFWYEPRSLFIGLRVSMGAAALVALGLIPIVVQRLRNRKRWP
jgi:hypothetical protein